MVYRDKRPRKGRGIKVSDLNREISTLVAQLNGISKNIAKDSKKILRPAGEIYVREIQKRVPISKKKHYRYKSKRRFATYYPGNLKRSIQDLKLQNTSAVIIGPKVTGGTGGTFSGTRTDGWYAKIIDRGAPAVGRRPKEFDLITKRKSRGAYRRALKKQRYAKQGGIKGANFIRKGVISARPRALVIIQRRLIERIKTLQQ